MNELPRFLRTEDAARRIGVKPATLETWRSRPPKNGAPRFIRRGSRLILYPIEELDA